MFFFLNGVSCVFTSVCYLNEFVDAKNFETETLKYFNSAQSILSCGRKFKNNFNSESKYKNCILSIEIHQKYKNDLLTFTSKNCENEFNFKEAIEVGAFNFCNSFQNSSFSESDLINAQVITGEEFNFNANVDTDADINFDKKYNNNNSILSPTNSNSAAVGIKPKQQFQMNHLAIVVGSLIFILFIGCLSYYISSTIKKSNEAPSQHEHVSHYSPDNYYQNHANSQNLNFTEASPPSYEEVNRPFHSFSADKIPYQHDRKY